MPIYHKDSRPSSVPSEYLLRTLVIQFLHSMQSFPLLVDRIHSDVAFH